MDKVHTIDNSKEYIPEKVEAPTDTPPAENPPAETPPAENPPAETPPAENPPAENPPADAKAEGATSGKDAAAGDPGILDSINATLAEIKGQLAKPEGQEQQQSAADPLADIDRALADLQEKARDGEITYEELVAQTTPLVSERAAYTVRQQLAQEAQQGQIANDQGRFLQENPDFEAFVRSPEAAAIVGSNSVMNNVSAYYAHKSAQMAQANAELQTQIAGLQQQIQNSIKNAGKGQAVVGGEDAAPVGVPQTYRGDGKTALDGGLAALRRVREN